MTSPDANKVFKMQRVKKERDIKDSGRIVMTSRRVKSSMNSYLSPERSPQKDLISLEKLR